MEKIYLQLNGVNIEGKKTMLEIRWKITFTLHAKSMYNRETKMPNVGSPLYKHTRKRKASRINFQDENGNLDVEDASLLLKKFVDVLWSQFWPSAIITIIEFHVVQLATTGAGITEALTMTAYFSRALSWEINWMKMLSVIPQLQDCCGGEWPIISHSRRVFLRRQPGTRAGRPAHVTPLAIFPRMKWGSDQIWLYSAVWWLVRPFQGTWRSLNRLN